jgi:hypothetical protein
MESKERSFDYQGKKKKAYNQIVGEYRDPSLMQWREGNKSSGSCFSNTT